MQLDNLQKLVDRPKKRVGRGNGSGKGKTSARGQKGQKARGSIRVDFEGGQLRIIKRLPFKRGVGNLPANKKSEIKVGLLAIFKADSVVNSESLQKVGLIKKTSERIKIIGGGEVSLPLKIEVPTTKSVREMIEKVGGTVS